MRALHCCRNFLNSERRIVVHILAFVFLVASNLFSQTWQSLGIRYSVNNAADMSVGYSGSTRVIYLAAKEDSLLRADGSTITWVNKPFVKSNFVACVSTNPNIVYAGGVNNAGVWKSTNGGISWTQILTSDNLLKMTISPLNSNNLFAGGSGTANIGLQSSTVTLYYSQNGGSSWNSTDLPSFNLTVTQIVCDPSNGAIVYTSAIQSNGGVFISINNGQNWTRKITGMSNIDVQALAITPQSTAVLYAGTKLGSSAQIYKTTNSGDNWSEVYSSTTVEIKDIKVDPFSSSTVYAATSQGVLKSTNSGSSWSAVNSGIADLDAKSIVVDNQSPSNRVYVGTTGAFYISTDGGSSWSDQSTGSELMSVGGMAVYNNNVYYVSGNNTTVLTAKRSSSGSVWEPIANQIISGTFFNGKDLKIDPYNSSLLYAAGKNSDSYGPKVLKSTNAGVSWNTIYQPIWDPYSDHAANTIFVEGSFVCIGTHYTNLVNSTPVMYSTNSGSSWNVPNPYPATHIFTLGYDPANSYMYAGGGEIEPHVCPAVFKSTYLASSWNEVSICNIVEAVTNQIVVDPDGYDIVYAMGTNPTFLYKSTNYGSTWTAISVPGDGTAYSSLVHHPFRTQTIYLSRNRGGWEVMQSIDGGTNWSTISTGLPSTNEIKQLVFDTELTNWPRYLYASTAGGVYKLDLQPFAPKNVVVANYYNNPRVTWATNPETDLAANPYKVFRKIIATDGSLIQDWRLIATVSGTSYIDNTIGVMPKPYQYVIYYKMTATDLAGTQSDYSNTTQISVHDLFWKQGGTENQDLPKPDVFLLSQNHPNPFNPSTTINYQLPEDSHVMIKVFDMLGRDVATLVDEYKTVGYHNVQFDGSKFSSGIYIYKMVAGKYVSAKKFSLMK